MIKNKVKWGKCFTNKSVEEYERKKRKTDGNMRHDTLLWVKRKQRRYQRKFEQELAKFKDLNSLLQELAKFEQEFR